MQKTMRLTGRVIKYPVIFATGWLFNLVYNTEFVMGFAAGWFAHTWIGGILL